MNRRQFGRTAGAGLIALALAACGKEDAPPAPPAAAPALSNAQMYEQAATANGFSVGPMMAANTAYIFFDTACPHCAVVWNSAKPLAGKLRIVWIPVGFLSKASAPRGAAILAAADPAKAMDANESTVLSGQQSGEPASVDADAAAKVAANTGMMRKFGADGVPLIIYKNARSGEYGAQAGQLDTDQLAALLGVQ
ncbi:DsbC family protein [Oxalobacteraceae bacterium CAVE-383]|nr:DsbC family protein [Oxalobacteraceae bacterium CAVE-383]